MIKRITPHEARSHIEKFQGERAFSIFNQDTGDKLVERDVSFSVDHWDILLEENDLKTVLIHSNIKNGFTSSGSQRWRTQDTLTVTFGEDATASGLGEPTSESGGEAFENTDDISSAFSPPKKPNKKKEVVNGDPLNIQGIFEGFPGYEISRLHRELHDTKTQLLRAQDKIEKLKEKVGEQKIELMQKDHEKDAAVKLNGVKANEILNSSAVTKFMETAGPGIGRVLEKLADSSPLAGASAGVQLPQDIAEINTWYMSLSEQARNTFYAIVSYLAQHKDIPEELLNNLKAQLAETPQNVTEGGQGEQAQYQDVPY